MKIETTKNKKHRGNTGDGKPREENRNHQQNTRDEERISGIEDTLEENNTSVKENIRQS